MDKARHTTIIECGDVFVRSDSASLKQVEKVVNRLLRKHRSYLELKKVDSLITRTNLE